MVSYRKAHRGRRTQRRGRGQRGGFSFPGHNPHPGDP